MKGQRLFVRLAIPSDLEELQNFYRRELAEPRNASEAEWIDDPDPVTESVIGKLVGDVVAHFRFDRSGDSINLRSMYVARSLRRKRIGRFMIAELCRLAGTSAARLVAPASCEAASFLHACGFEMSDDEGPLTMRIDLEEEP